MGSHRVEVKCTDKKGRRFLSLGGDFSRRDAEVGARPDFRCWFTHQGTGIDWHGVSPANVTLDVPLLTDALTTQAGRTIQQGLKVSRVRSGIGQK